LAGIESLVKSSNKPTKMQGSKPGLPIFLENTPHAVCEQVLWLIKNSGLHFQIKESPFSLNISLQKRFANHWNQLFQGQHFVNPVSPQVQTSESQDIHLQQSLENSELLKQVDSLKASFEEAVNDNGETHANLLELDKAHRKLNEYKAQKLVEFKAAKKAERRVGRIKREKILLIQACLKIKKWLKMMIPL
jgi:hypothetical protein